MTASRSLPPPNPVSSSGVRFAQDQLVPAQQPTSVSLTKSTDYYEQRCVKFAQRGAFHSYAELIHALLLEADRDVTSFVPQPYQLLVNRRFYIPDVYAVRSGRIQILELKPEGKFDREKEAMLVAFFDQYGMHFEVVANESVLEQEQLALNWLPLIQVLAQALAQGIDTQVEEQRLYDIARAQDSLAVGDLLHDSSRQEQYPKELALYRLLHRHDLVCDLTQRPLNYDTVIAAWN